MAKKILVILSGGQDSTTCLFLAKAYYGYEVHAITFDYGQRHRREIEAAAKVAEMAGVQTHEFVKLGPILKGASPLTDNAAELEEYTYDTIAAPLKRPRSTFVPMRNQLFLTIAANHAYAMGCNNIAIGACLADANGYPDCTPEFLRAFEAVSNRGTFTEEPLIVSAPLLYLSKAESVRLANDLPGCMDALAYSHTAYDGKYPPCGNDHANLTRAAGFEEAGVPDPLILRAFREGLMPLPETKNYDSIRDEEKK